jgi:uncharacterized protein (DUF4415 family)
VVPAEPGKARITIRLDKAVLNWFRSEAHEAGGASYQGLINEALLRHIAATQEPLEGTLRRVIREELKKAG